MPTPDRTTACPTCPPSPTPLSNYVSTAVLLLLLSFCCLLPSATGQSTGSSSSSSMVPYDSSSSSSTGATSFGNPNQTVIHIAVCIHGDPTNTSDIMYKPLSYNTSATMQTYIRGVALHRTLLNLAGGAPTYLNNVTVLFQLHWFNLGASGATLTPRAAAVAKRIVNGTYGYNFTVILAPVASSDAIVTNFFQTCETTKTCIAIAPLTITSSDYICTPPLPAGCLQGHRRFQYAFSVLYDNNYILESHLSAFRQKGIKNVAVLYSWLTYGVQAAAVTTDTVLGLGMNVQMSTMLPNATAFIWTTDQIAAYVAELQALQVEVICIPSTAADSAAVQTVLALINYFKAVDWLPSAIVFAGAISTSVQTALAPADYAYMFSAVQWDWHLKGNNYETVNVPGVNLELFPAVKGMASPAVFRQAMFNTYNTTIADSIMPYAVDGGAALNMVQKFIELAGAYDVESLRQASKQISVPTPTGKLQMDPYGRPDVNDPVAYQTLINGSNIIIAPFSISVNPILPMPQFWERTFQPVYLGQPMEKAAVAFAAIAMCATTFFILMFIIYRTHPVMKASTPLFCVLMALGGLFMQSSVFATGLYVTTAACHAQVWLLTVGFSMLFGALFMKTYRVWRIFNAGKKLMKVAITNRQLLLALGALLSFDVILNIVWSALGAFNAMYVSVDVYRPYYDYVQCDTQSSTTQSVLYVTLIEKAVLVFASVILTFATRNVPSKFNETPYLASAIYNCALMLCFMVPIIATGIGGREVSYAVRVFGVQALVLVTLSIVFVPKFYLMWGVEERRLKEMEKANPHAGDTNTESGGHGSTLKAKHPHSKQGNGSSNHGNESSGANTPQGARVHPASSRAQESNKGAEGAAGRHSISTESGKFLQLPNNGKDSPHNNNTSNSVNRSPQQPGTANPRFARPQMTSNAFVKAEPLPGQLDGHTGGQQSDIHPMMPNETGEDARQPSASTSVNGADQPRRGSTDNEEADLRVDESDSLSALVSKSLRLTQRLTQFQAALDTVNKELDKRKKGSSKSPMQSSHTVAEDNSTSHTHSSNTQSPLESDR